MSKLTVESHREPLSHPLVFTMIVSEILGSLISDWTAQGVGWSFDQLLMTCLAYADDVLLFADSLEKSTRM